MASIKLYTIIFGALMMVSTLQAAFEYTGLLEEFYWGALVVILILSTIKASVVAGWYMHVREEPRAIAYLALAGVIGVVALTAGAAYSVL